MSPDGAPKQRARSLADDLRARDDAALRTLLAARPDLLNPVPSDIASLAARAASRPSVQRALDAANLFCLQVVDALCLLPDRVDAGEVVRLIGADEAATRSMLSLLRDQALLYGTDEDLTVVRTVREIVGLPAGLGPPAEQAFTSYGPARLERLLTDLALPPTGDPLEAARRIAGLFGDPARLTDLLEAAPREAVEAARVLAEGPPTGRLDRARREIDAATAATPVEWLLARGVLVPLDEVTVVLPREVGLHLRGGRVHPDARPEPPELEVTVIDSAVVDRTAAGAAFTVVRLVEDLLELWSTDPPKGLRAGGIGVRERARTAAAIDVEEDVLSLVAEVAHAAALLDLSAAIDEVWLPTPRYDEWLKQDIAQRWLALVTGWVETTRVAGLAGTTDERGKTVPPLGRDLERGVAPQVRRTTLDLLASAPADPTEGGTPAPTVDSVLARLSWHAPRRATRLRDDIARWTVAEAEALGVTARGGLSSAGRLLLRGNEEAALRVITGHLPKPVEHMLLQADLTAVAPGPLTTDLAHRLRLVADVESTGGATVYRFSAASVRRALDAGWSGGDVLELLERHSRTPVPQPLSYLVHDVARRHGGIRVGGAASYIRCDDEALLGEILAERRTGQLRLRRLAPTVLAAQAPVDVVLGRLREIGYAPAGEGADGAVVVRRPDARRAVPRAVVSRLIPERESPQPALLNAAVRALRSGDRALLAVRRRAADVWDDAHVGVPTRRPTADVLATLQEAAAAGEPLLLGYVNAEGHPSQRVVEPIAVEGGYVSAYDHLREEVRTFSVHRITGIATLEDD